MTDATPLAVTSAACTYHTSRIGTTCVMDSHVFVCVTCTVFTTIVNAAAMTRGIQTLDAANIIDVSVVRKTVVFSCRYSV